MKETTRISKRIGFVADRLAVGSPAQHLLDRFLAGFCLDGAVVEPSAAKIRGWAGQGSDAALLEQRARDFGLEVASTAAAAAEGVDALVVVQPENRLPTNTGELREIVSSLASGTPVYFYGLPAADADGARDLAALAKTKGLPLFAAGALATTWQLPKLKFIPGMRIREALIVVQGAPTTAEWHALDGLMTFTEARRGAGKAQRVRHATGGDVWTLQGETGWSWELLQAALSRSDSPQGNSIVDGRTEDLAGLGLVPKLAKDPRCWLVEHADGLRLSILVLDGVVKDVLLAMKTGGSLSAERTFSTQLFQAPAPQLEHFSRLAGEVSRFFETGKAPWSFERAIKQCGFLSHFSKPENRAPGWIAYRE